MESILEYLDWRGDITFLERPFNEVDNLLLAELSYLDFGGIVPETFGGGVALHAAMDAFTKRSPKVEMGVLVPDRIPLLGRKMAASARFRAVRLSGYVCRIDEASETQFAALCAALPDGTVYAAFRGTDDTIVGWKEDFNMAFLPEVPAQREAVRYLQAVGAAAADGVFLEGAAARLRVGGHSKGGNLAVYSAVWCGAAVQEQIIAVYNNDGPGFHTSLLELPEHRRIAGKIQTILPESSVVGMLLEHEETYQVVRSSQSGLMQHDGLSWQVLGTEFVHLSGLTEGGRLVDETLREFVRGLDEGQRETLVDTMFEILTCTDAQTLTELKEGGVRTVYSMAKEIRALDQPTRRALTDTLRLLVRSGAKRIADAPGVRRVRKWKFVDRVLKKLEAEDGGEEA